MKLRKIVTMGMATLMAVSAMSLSAFACENPEDAIISVLAPDGENNYYSHRIPRYRSYSKS